jgi:hypothetical protein
VLSLVLTAVVAVLFTTLGGRRRDHGGDHRLPVLLASASAGRRPPDLFLFGMSIGGILNSPTALPRCSTCTGDDPLLRSPMRLMLVAVVLR